MANMSIGITYNSSMASYVHWNNFQQFYGKHVHWNNFQQFYGKLVHWNNLQQFSCKHVL